MTHPGALPLGSSPSPADPALAVQLAEISAREMIEQLGFTHTPRMVRAGLVAGLSWVSGRLGRALARFDGRIGTVGIASAAEATLRELGATWEVTGPRPPREGPLLVVSNHPGAYDALVLLAALGRQDVMILAANRSFLRALPELGRHLLLLANDGRAGGQVAAVRQAFAHLKRGHAVLHFPAGRIEPDPAFVVSDAPLLAWRAGTGALVRATARASGSIAGALVGGVHSPRAKRHWAVRWAERRGVTTVALLLQMVARRFHDVHATVHFTDAVFAATLLDGEGDDAAITAQLRDTVGALRRAAT